MSQINQGQIQWLLNNHLSLKLFKNIFQCIRVTIKDFFHTILRSHSHPKNISDYGNFPLGPCYIFLVPYTSKEQILIQKVFLFNSSFTHSLGCVATRNKMQYKEIFLNTSFTNFLCLLHFRNIMHCIRILLQDICLRLLGLVFIKKLFQRVRIF